MIESETAASEAAATEPAPRGPVSVIGAQVFPGPNLFAPLPVLALTVKTVALPDDQLARLEEDLDRLLGAVAQSLIAFRWRRFPPAHMIAMGRGIVASRASPFGWSWCRRV